MDVAWEREGIVNEGHETAAIWGIVEVAASAALSGLMSTILNDLVIWEYLG